MRYFGGIRQLCLRIHKEMPEAVTPSQPPQTEHSVLDVIRSRWSPVIFSPRTVEPEKLLSVLEAARWAPSSFNEQPWSFLVARKEEPEEFARMLSCLVPGNVTWAQHVPVLLISVAKLQFEHNHETNRHAVHDTGIATGFLMLQAAALGLAAHGMAGWDILVTTRKRRKRCVSATFARAAVRSTNSFLRAAGGRHRRW